LPYEDLRAFLKDLEKAGDLRRVRAEVDPRLEISEIAQRVVRREGPALLFENPKGFRVPVLINAFGSHRRMARALGVERYEEVAERLEALLEPETPTGLLDKIRMLPRLAELSAMFPKTVRDAPCKEVVVKDDPGLEFLPVITCWPGDGGPYLTMPLVVTVDPRTGKRNCGMYRMQVFDRRTTAMHWHLHKDGKRHFDRAAAEGKRLEVAVALGCDPAVSFAACVPAPPDVDEMLIAGFLRGKPVPMVRCETVDLEVPGSAEIVLEGFVDPGERRREGPFGDHTGFYSLPDEYPVFHLTCVTHRRDPIYQTIVVGPPPQEDDYLGTAIERLTLPILKKQFPEIVDVHMPWEGVFHNLMLVSIEKRFPGHARKVMHGIWGLGQAMFTKVIVVVDADVDVQEVREVAWKALNHIDPERDFEFVLGPVETLDHASRLPHFGSKVGIDATRKWPSEGFARPWPDEMKMAPEIAALVERRWGEYGIDAPMGGTGRRP
jgi:4-hydroxy-3-polyprenylbenzoate decarboxylase